jgi:hypothetical protein
MVIPSAFKQDELNRYPGHFTGGCCMKKILIVLILAATAANAQNYQSNDNGRAMRFSESLDAPSADFRVSTLPLRTEPAAITAENKRVFSAGLGSNMAANEAITSQTEDLKERMMNDKGIMSIISALQNDPEMQTLLSDPAIMSAVQSGDIGTLLGNPAFLKFLDNPRVREIEKSLQPGGAR